MGYVIAQYGYGYNIYDFIKGVEVDINKDTFVRSFGDYSKVGESLRYIFPRLVTPSYIISFGFCLADTADKMLK